MSLSVPIKWLIERIPRRTKTVKQTNKQKSCSHNLDVTPDIISGVRHRTLKLLGFRQSHNLGTWYWSSGNMWWPHSREQEEDGVQNEVDRDTHQQEVCSPLSATSPYERRDGPFVELLVHWGGGLCIPHTPWQLLPALFDFQEPLSGAAVPSPALLCRTETLFPVSPL